MTWCAILILRKQTAEDPFAHSEAVGDGGACSFGCGFAARHVLRCSSDRKKLIVVHRESEALHCSSTRFPNQSMMPLASGPGPCGVAGNIKAALQ